MNILVTVASKHGSAWGIGAEIAQELRAVGHTVDLRRPESVEGINDYEAVVFGSAIYAGSWLPEARQFAEHYQMDLMQRPLWVFSSGPLGAPDPQPHDDPQKLAAPLGTVPVRDHHIFVGAVDSEHLGFMEHVIMRAVKAPSGDFRDWEDIRTWARSIAADLPVLVH